MPRLYFHTRNGHDEVRDEEGLDIGGDAAAYAVGVESIRSIVADEARRGLIDVGGHLDIADDQGRLMMTISFAEAFEIRLPGDDEAAR